MLVYFFLLQLLSHLDFTERPTVRVVRKVIVRVAWRENLQALPAEFSIALLADHFVAPCDLLDGELARWALLRALANVEQVESLID